MQQSNGVLAHPEIAATEIHSWSDLRFVAVPPVWILAAAGIIVFVIWVHRENAAVYLKNVADHSCHVIRCAADFIRALRRLGLAINVLHMSQPRLLQCVPGVRSMLKRRIEYVTPSLRRNW